MALLSSITCINKRSSLVLHTLTAVPSKNHSSESVTKTSVPSGRPSLYLPPHMSPPLANVYNLHLNPPSHQKPVDILKSHRLMVFSSRQKPLGLISMDECWVCRFNSLQFLTESLQQPLPTSVINPYWKKCLLT